MSSLYRLSIIAFALSAYPPTALAQSPLFGPGRRIAVPPGSGTIVIADINGDRRVDILTRHLQPQLIAIFLGDGRGGFRPAPKATLRFDYAPADMKLGDLDGDGALDLAVTHNERDVVDILTGDGRAGFVRAAGFPIIVSAAVDSFNKRSLHLVDLDEDGDLDVVTANGRRLNTLSTLLGDGRGSFRPGPIVRLDSARDGYSFGFADIDGDRHLDVVAVTRTSFDERSEGRVVILKGNGRGTFARSDGPPAPTPPGPLQLTVQDVDGDSQPDLLMTHADGAVTLWSNRGAGRFDAPRVIHRFRGPAYSLVVADLDGDRRPDVSAATVNSVTVLLNGRAGFTHAAGSPYPAGPGAYYLTPGDLNGDTKPDLVSSSFEGSSVRILLRR